MKRSPASRVMYQAHNERTNAVPDFIYSPPSVILIDRPQFDALAHEADRLLEQATWANVVEDSGNTDEFLADLHTEGYFPVIDVEGPKGPTAEWTLTIVVRLRDDYEGPCDTVNNGNKYAAAELVISPDTFFSLPHGKFGDGLDWLDNLHPEKVWAEALA